MLFRWLFQLTVYSFVAKAIPAANSTSTSIETSDNITSLSTSISDHLPQASNVTDGLLSQAPNVTIDLLSAYLNTSNASLSDADNIRSTSLGIPRVANRMKLCIDILVAELDFEPPTRYVVMAPPQHTTEVADVEGFERLSAIFHFNDTNVLLMVSPPPEGEVPYSRTWSRPSVLDVERSARFLAAGAFLWTDVQRKLWPSRAERLLRYAGILQQFQGLEIKAVDEQYMPFDAEYRFHLAEGEYDLAWLSAEAPNIKVRPREHDASSANSSNTPVAVS